MATGVYMIVFAPTGERYIGSTVDLPRRKREHRGNLRRGKHRRLQERYSGDLGAFRFTTLWEAPEGTAPERLIKAEAWFIERKQPELNIVRRPELPPFTGKALSASHRERIGAALRGRAKSPEHVEALAAAQRGKRRGPLSLEHRIKISESKRGHQHTVETRRRMSLSKMGNTNRAGARP